jgi:hypothetical protein
VEGGRLRSPAGGGGGACLGADGSHAQDAR